MKKFILFVILLVASFSFANTIAGEKAGFKTTDIEIFEVSNDSSSLETVYIDSDEDWTYCYTRVWIVVLSVEYLAFSDQYLITYEDWSYTVCITLD